MNRIIPVLIILLIIQSCATQRTAEEKKITAYEKGDYEAALQAFEQVIDKKESEANRADPSVYYKAGMAAWKTGATHKALEYLQVAEYMEYPSPKMYIALARISYSIDNLSKEIDALEGYHEKYPQGDQIDSMTVRLFETYVESENWNKAADLWPEVKDLARSGVDLLTGYLIVNRGLGNDSVSYKLAEQILEVEPNNIPALEWKAKQSFWKAEKRYVKEMTAYKNNRTTSQYDRLLKALDEIYATFEKSRDYFLKLYELDPKPEYAKFLGNIYSRLQEEDKAEYYKRKAK